MPTQRQLRVNNLIRDEIASILLRDLDDPHVGFTTITGVEVTADLQHARVHISVLGDDAAKRETLSTLRRAKGFIRGLLQDRLDLRYTPNLHFALDDTAEKADQLHRVLLGLAQEDGEQDEPDPE